MKKFSAGEGEPPHYPPPLPPPTRENSVHMYIFNKNGSQSTVSLWDLAPIIDSNNETLQEHLDEMNISHNDM